MNSGAVESRVAAPHRRGLLFAGVAAAAALAGAGLGWRKWQADSEPDVAAAIWPLAFDTPTGSRLSMESFRGKPLLLNFWATWCPPCVEEMPMLDGFLRQNAAKGWQVVGLAIDRPDPVRAFVAQTHVTFPIGLANSGGQELSRTLGNVAGGLPFTVVVGAAGKVLQRRMGRVTPAELGDWSKLK
jgi:thiol-disulfide isomerase/thioredoxin